MKPVRTAGSFLAKKVLTAGMSTQLAFDPAKAAGDLAATAA